MNDTDDRYRELHLPVPEDRLAAVVRLAEDADAREYVCFEGEEGWSIAVGRAAALVADRQRVVLHGRGGRTELPWDLRSMSAVPHLLATAGIAGWRAYGWCGFDLAAAKAGRLDLVGDEPFLHLMIPEVEVRMGPSRTVVRALRSADLEWIRSRLEGCAARAAEPAPSNGSRPDLFADPETGRRDYEVAVATAVRAIELGRVEKVVLSRRIPLSIDVDLVGTFAAGRRRTSPFRSFLFELGDVAAAGLSPESVVRVSGDGEVTCELLAGTRAPRGPDADATARRELLRDAKEVFEHAISVRAAIDELGTVCDPASVVVTDLLSVRNCNGLRHLASTIRGRLDGGRNAWDAFTALFPAVTLTGTPKLAAYELIRELEGESRGVYGGAVLTFEPGAALDTAAALRTVFRGGGRTWIQAGAGIVQQSRPEREFTETCEKARTIGQHVVPRRGAAVPGEAR